MQSVVIGYRVRRRRLALVGFGSRLAEGQVRGVMAEGAKRAGTPLLETGERARGVAGMGAEVSFGVGTGCGGTHCRAGLARVARSC